MSKLFNLKKWLTVEDAAKHLSLVFDEPVTDYDIYRFALDGYLKLSVNLVNYAHAKQKKIVSINEVLMLPSLDGLYKVPIGLEFDDKNYLNNVDGEVICINGVLDLMMLGSEMLDIEHKYQQLTSGVEVTLVSLEGAYLQNPVDKVIYELQESFDDNQYTRGSKAEFKKIKARIELENIGEEEANLLINQHKEDRKKYKESRLKDYSSDYYPAVSLPSDAAIVVRTAELSEFIEVVSENKKIEKPLIDKERETLLIIIAALAKEAKVDITKISKAGELIANLTQQIGVSVGATTIETHLRKIPQALESRAK